jgi:hypothetical protein
MSKRSGKRRHDIQEKLINVNYTAVISCVNFKFNY